ncbi:MAG TPA: TfoX/Sxy family protein [Polyangiaceae bacterium]
MSYDEHLAARIRQDLAEKKKRATEKKMFGGVCFLVGGKMCCGITKDDFLVRVGKEGFADAIAQPHAREMDFTGTPSTSTVYVAKEGLRTKAMLGRWIDRGIAVAEAAKKTKPKRARKKTR